MAHLANRAALTESEAEAEAFIGALVPIAAKLIPRAGQADPRKRTGPGHGGHAPRATAPPRPGDAASGEGHAGGAPAHRPEPGRPGRRGPSHRRLRRGPHARQDDRPGDQAAERADGRCRPSTSSTGAITGVAGGSSGVGWRRYPSYGYGSGSPAAPTSATATGRTSSRSATARRRPAYARRYRGVRAR